MAYLTHPCRDVRQRVAIAVRDNGVGIAVPFAMIRGIDCVSPDRKERYGAWHAGDGLRALELLSNGAVKSDLIILDPVMPEMNGFEFRESLLKNQGQDSTAPRRRSARVEEDYVAMYGSPLTDPRGDTPGRAASALNRSRRAST